MVAGKITRRVFLSASVPLAGRHPKYFESADVIAIRESIRALIAVAVPSTEIVFGGHPAITPMIALTAGALGFLPTGFITLYQSTFFQGEFPEENERFGRVVRVDAAGGDRALSLALLRKRMIGDRDFACAIFIGGMEGVEEEFEVFRALHPERPFHPIASTGAAARILFERHCPDRTELSKELRYLSLFRRLLSGGPAAGR